MPRADHEPRKVPTIDDDAGERAPIAIKAFPPTYPNR